MTMTANVNEDRLRRQRLGKQARDAAVLFILDKYREEFELRVQKERVERGLPRTANQPSPEHLEEQLKKAKERTAALEAKLRDARRSRPKA